MARRRSNPSRDYPRTARLNELYREILAEELERLDDDRLTLVTIMGVEVEGDLRSATVFWSATAADPDEEGVARIQAALEELRPHLQAEINRQAHVRRVPVLRFRPDPAVVEGFRIDDVIRGLHERGGGEQP